MRMGRRITDHDEILAAARVDRSREGAAMIKRSLIALWQLVHRAGSALRQARRARRFAARLEHFPRQSARE